MEPESLIVIVCGILLALTMLPGAPKRQAGSQDMDITDYREPEELQHCLK